MAEDDGDQPGTDTLAWRDRARCAEIDVELFFSNDEDTRARALELCRECGVREECYRFAVDHGEMYGIWGGTQESDRRGQIRERRRRQREQAEAA